MMHRTPVFEYMLDLTTVLTHSEMPDDLGVLALQKRYPEMLAWLERHVSDWDVTADIILGYAPLWCLAPNLNFYDEDEACLFRLRFGD